MAWVTKDSQETYENNEPVRTYTRKEKAGNWWHYHKWQVIIGIIAVVVAACIIKDTVFRPVPDYQVAYVGQQGLPNDTAEALTAALESSFCEDRNGDGQVLVQLNQYTLDLGQDTDNVDAYTQMAGVTRLSADLSSSDGSYIFLLEDPAAFQNYTGGLRYLDGSVPDGEETATDWENMVYRWTDCPVLAGLELGTYTGYTLVDDATGNNQDVLGRLYVGCRGTWTEKAAESYGDDEVLWQKLTEGAVSTAERN